jgi:hypothetical protein
VHARPMLATTLPDRTSDLRSRPAGDRPSTGVDLVHDRAPVDAPRRALAETARERLDPHCLPPAVLADMLASCGWGHVTVLGDAIESGVGDPVDGYRDVSWVARLDDAVHGRDVTRPERAPRRTGDVEPATDLVIVSARADDVLTPGLDPGIGAEVDAEAGALAARGALVVALGPLEISCGVPTDGRGDLHDGLRTLDHETRCLAARHRGVHVDLLGDPAFGPDMMSADGRRANRRGHAHIAALVARALVTHRRAER